MFGSTWLDVIVLALVAVFAVAGWGRGLLRTLIWGAGVSAGALVGLVIFPQIAERIFNNALLLATIAFSGVVAGAIMGGIGAGIVSKLIRPVVLPLGILRLLDHIAGALVGGAAMAVVIWLVASSIVVSWVDQLESLPSSRVVVVVEQYLPSQVREGLIVVIDRFGLPVEISEPASEPNQSP